MTGAISDSALAEAAGVLRAGGLVAFPTETVYGLGADASSPAALSGIFALKGRPADHPLIVHVGDATLVEQWAARVPEAARALIARFWPGPLTLVLEKRPGVPDLVTGGQDTVALRMPRHPVALGLLRAFGGGVAAPSANRFGRISPTAAAHVREEFGAACPMVLDGGPCTVGVESTILSLAYGPPRVLRPGGITCAMIAEVLGERPGGAAADAPRVPGALDVHYAPAAPALVCDAASLRRRLTLEPGAAAMPIGALPAGAQGVPMPAGAADYARALYAVLRQLDRARPACILIEAPPRDEPWQAVWDRLRRAARVESED